MAVMDNPLSKACRIEGERFRNNLVKDLGGIIAARGNDPDQWTKKKFNNINYKIDPSLTTKGANGEHKISKSGDHEIIFPSNMVYTKTHAHEVAHVIASGDIEQIEDNGIVLETYRNGFTTSQRKQGEEKFFGTNNLGRSEAGMDLIAEIMLGYEIPDYREKGTTGPGIQECKFLERQIKNLFGKDTYFDSLIFDPKILDEKMQALLKTQPHSLYGARVSSNYAIQCDMIHAGNHVGEAYRDALRAIIRMYGAPILLAKDQNELQVARANFAKYLDSLVLDEKFFGKETRTTINQYKDQKREELLK